jgi:hypothetical protein
VEAVGNDADRAGGVAECEFRDRDRQVQKENAKQDAVNRGVASRQGEETS